MPPSEPAPIVPETLFLSMSFIMVCRERSVSEARLAGDSKVVRRTLAAELTTSCLSPFEAPPFELKSLAASLMAAQASELAGVRRVCSTC